MEVQQAIKSALEANRAKARKILEAKKSPPIKNNPGKLVRQMMMAGALASAAAQTEKEETISPPIGTAQAIMAESTLPTTQRFDAEQARASVNAREAEPDPSVARMGANGYLDQAQTEAYQAQMNALNEQARAATTVAEMQAINIQQQNLTNQTNELGLDQEQKQLTTTVRGVFWDVVEESLPAMDLALFETDFGIGTGFATVIDDFREGYGLILGGNPEPDTSWAVFLPPPIRAIPEPNESLAVKAKTIWEVGWSAGPAMVQVTVAILVGFLVLAFVATVVSCGSDIITASTDSLCRDLGSGFTDVLSAISSSPTPTPTTSTQ